MALNMLLQVCVGGLVVGGLYALVAIGLSLIYGVTRILNFAHGTVVVVSGIAGSLLFARYGLSPVLIIAVVAPVCAVCGYYFYAFLIRPIMHRSHFEATVGTVLVTIGAFLIITDLTAFLAGPEQRNILVAARPIEAMQGLITEIQLYVLIGVSLLTLLLHYLFRYTWFGMSVRALTQDQFAASAYGVPSELVRGLTFACGTALAAVAGILYALVYPVEVHGGFELTVKAFTIIVIGGIGSLPGALLASVGLGVAEAIVAFYLSSEWVLAVSIGTLLGLLTLFPRVGLGRHH